MKRLMVFVLAVAATACVDAATSPRRDASGYEVAAGNKPSTTIDCRSGYYVIAYNKDSVCVDSLPQ